MEDNSSPVMSLLAGSQRSSGAVEASSVHSSSLSSLLLLKELTDVFRGHNLSENRVTDVRSHSHWHEKSQTITESLTFPSAANLCRKSFSSVFMSLYPEKNKKIQRVEILSEHVCVIPVVLRRILCCTMDYFKLLNSVQVVQRRHQGVISFMLLFVVLSFFLIGRNGVRLVQQEGQTSFRQPLLGGGQDK